MLRRARIVTAVFCLAGCAVLGVMWFRSYQSADQLQIRTRYQRGLIVAAKQGRLVVVLRNWPTANHWDWKTLHYPVHNEMSFPVGDARQYDAALGFGVLRRPAYMVTQSTFETPAGGTIYISGAASATLDAWGLSVPFWFLVMMAGALGVALSRNRPWQFSTRGLLIVVTVIAIVLGLVVSLDRPPKNWELDEPVPLDGL